MPDANEIIEEVHAFAQRKLEKLLRRPGYFIIRYSAGRIEISHTLSVEEEKRADEIFEVCRVRRTRSSIILYQIEPRTDGECIHPNIRSFVL